MKKAIARVIGIFFVGIFVTCWGPYIQESIAGLSQSEKKGGIEIEIENPPWDRIYDTPAPSHIASPDEFQKEPQKEAEAEIKTPTLPVPDEKKEEKRGRLLREDEW